MKSCVVVIVVVLVSSLSRLVLFNHLEKQGSNCVYVQLITDRSDTNTSDIQENWLCELVAITRYVKSVTEFNATVPLVDVQSH